LQKEQHCNKQFISVFCRDNGSGGDLVRDKVYGSTWHKKQTQINGQMSEQCLHLTEIMLFDENINQWHDT
jgi:hypothetical protein